MYFAEDYNTTTKILPNYISNGRDAVGARNGTITKTTASGNGATGAITYISGSTDTRMEFPAGSIPQQFTILGLFRYNGGTRARILQALELIGFTDIGEEIEVLFFIMMVGNLVVIILI